MALDRTREALVATRDWNAAPRWRRCQLLTEGFPPRRGRWVLPVTLGPHHKPFGSAKTARGLRALDLVGELHAMWLARRRRGETDGAVREAREKGFDASQDRRTKHVTPASVFRAAREGQNRYGSHPLAHARLMLLLDLLL